MMESQWMSSVIIIHPKLCASKMSMQSMVDDILAAQACARKVFFSIWSIWLKPWKETWQRDLEKGKPGGRASGRQ